jgi:hypothetical protein
MTFLLVQALCQPLMERKNRHKRRAYSYLEKFILRVDTKGRERVRRLVGGRRNMGLP